MSAQVFNCGLLLVYNRCGCVRMLARCRAPTQRAGSVWDPGAGQTRFRTLAATAVP